MNNSKLIKLIFLALLVVSCNSNIPTKEVELRIKEHRFTPEIIEVPAGHRIILTIFNDDLTMEEFESIDLHREKIVPPKSKITIPLAPLKPGEYKFFGEFNADTAQGKIVAY